MRTSLQLAATLILVHALGGCNEKTAVPPINSEDVKGGCNEKTAVPPINSEDVKAQYESLVKEWEAELASAREILTQKEVVDEFTGMTIYEHPETPRGINARTCVYGDLAGGEGTVPQVTFTYVGRDWIFWEQVIVLIDGKPTRLTPTAIQDHDGGRVREWAPLEVSYGPTFSTLDTSSQVRISPSLANMMGTAKSVKVSFRGLDRADHTLTQWEKASILAVANIENKPSMEDARSIVERRAALEESAKTPPEGKVEPPTSLAE